MPTAQALAPTGELRTMTKKGDVRATWNARDADEVEAAKAQFDGLRAKGFSAFAVAEDGSPGTRIDEFDPNAQKVVLVPPLAGG